MPNPLSPIRVGPSGRYFQTFDGEPFLFLGANDALSWPGLEPLLGRRDLGAVETYLRSFADNGATILRVMLEYAHDDRFYFENPVGHFRPEMVGLWDDLFELCERVGLRILLTPWDTFWMARRWHRHPYNSKNGGPAASPGAFLTDDATIEASIRRFEFVIERWQGRAVIAAWDVWNEIHPHWGGTPNEQSIAIARQSRAIREAEKRVQSWTRPQTVSIFGPEPPGDYQELIFRHPDLDFASTHIYSNGAIDYPRNTVTAAAAMAQWTRYALERTPLERPYLDSEHGPIHLFNDHRRTLPARFDEEYERHLMWAHLCSGGAGGGLRWPARHPHVLTEGMKGAFKLLREFSRLVDWNGFVPTDWRNKIRLEGVSRRNCHLFAVGDGQQVFGVLLRRPVGGHKGVLPPMEPLQGARLTIGSVGDGPYEVVAFDPIKGLVLSQTQIRPLRGRVSFPLVAWEHEIAFVLRRASGDTTVL